MELVDATTPTTDPVLSNTGEPLEPFAKSAVIAIRGDPFSLPDLCRYYLEILPFDTVKPQPSGWLITVTSEPTGLSLFNGNG